MNLTIRLVPTDRTDLLCIRCFGFRTDLAICTDQDEPCAGVHTKCIEGLQFHNTGERNHEEAH